MLERVLSLFSAPPSRPEPLPEPDARLALGALLVRVAKSDFVYRAEEIGIIDRILSAHNGIGPIEAARLRATCERLEKQAPDTARFAELIRQSVPYDERCAIVTALWRVALADGEEDDAEGAVVHLAEQHLGLSPEDSDMAHERARAALKS